jgi:hypothetical protein
MEQPENYAVDPSCSLTWKLAWGQSQYRFKLIMAIALLLALSLCLPAFFAHIEHRQGWVLQDRVLQWLPALDVSIPTFIIIWSMIGWLLFRGIQDPGILLPSLYSFMLLFLLRVISISLVPLNPPAGLIPLKDPLSNFFYGHSATFITKDLFFSGHTATQLMIFYLLPGRREKILAFCATIAVGILVLIQHVHYSLDVAGALVISYFIVLAGRRMARCPAF